MVRRRLVGCLNLGVNRCAKCLELVPYMNTTTVSSKDKTTLILMPPQCTALDKNLKVDIEIVPSALLPPLHKLKEISKIEN